MIESVHNMLHLSLRQRIQVHPFGYILANEAIGVFVEPALPGMVRLGEIDRRVQRLADGPMVGKLLSIVGGNRLCMRLMRSKQGHGFIRHFVRLLGGHFAQQRVARAPLNQRDECALSFRAHHQVNFPVADPAFFLHDSRALINADPVFNLSSRIGFPIAFLAFFATVLQMLIQPAPAA